MTAKSEFIDGWMAAREYYGREEEGFGFHGAECDRVHNRDNICTCDPGSQYAAARSSWPQGEV